MFFRLKRLLNDPWFEDYCISLVNKIPPEIYFILLLSLILGVIVIVYKFKYNKVQNISKLLLFEYVFFILCSTIIYRESLPSRKILIKPLWSYSEVFAGKNEFLGENIMNVMAFVPIGLLLGLAIKRIRLNLIFAIGFCISLIIEFLQFILWKGASELDDVFHNTFGCILGFVCFIFFRCVYRWVRL